MSLNGCMLPTELLQSIFLLLDSESFHSASLTCRLWRNAALSTFMLRRQLGGVPALSKAASESLQHAALDDLESMFKKICRQNLIGMRRTIKFTSTSTTPMQAGDIPVHSSQCSYTAQLRGMTLTLQLSSPSQTPGVHEIQLSPTIFPTSDAVRQIIGYNHGGAFFKPRSFARMQVGLSECGMIAVALGVKIHVCSLADGLPMDEFVESNVSENGLDSIQRVEFVDGLLRVEVDSPEGAYVKYLGSQESRGMRGSPQLSYWKEGLEKVYLDSRTVEQSMGGGASLRGMRVFSPSKADPESVYFFSLLRQGSHENKYVVGRASRDGAVEIIQELPTRPASLNSLKEKTQAEANSTTTSGSLSMPDVDRWDTENLPCAHCPDPLLSVSDDGKILAIAEPPHGKDTGVVYICSLFQETTSNEAGGEPTSVPWPFVISTLDQPLESLHVKLDRDSERYIVDAQSQRQTTTSGSQMIQWVMSNAPRP